MKGKRRILVFVAILVSAATLVAQAPGAAQVRKPCRIEENSERMIAKMSSAKYSCRRLNATGSMRTEFLIGTVRSFCRPRVPSEQYVSFELAEIMVRDSYHFGCFSKRAFA